MRIYRIMRDRFVEAHSPEEAEERHMGHNSVVCEITLTTTVGRAMSNFLNACGDLRTPQDLGWGLCCYDVVSIEHSESITEEDYQVYGSMEAASCRIKFETITVSIGGSHHEE